MIEKSHKIEPWRPGITAATEAMARKVDRPIILPLSNPTDKSEAKARDLIRWTNWRALVATGSPFAPVNYDGRQINVAQYNNVYIFPAIGLALVASRATRVTNNMMLAAAQQLGRHSPALQDPSASLLPSLKDLRTVARNIAFAVGIAAEKDRVAPKLPEDELRARVTAAQWTPAYPILSSSAHSTVLDPATAPFSLGEKHLFRR